MQLRLTTQQAKQILNSRGNWKIDRSDTAMSWWVVRRNGKILGRSPNDPERAIRNAAQNLVLKTPMDRSQWMLAQLLDGKSLAQVKDLCILVAVKMAIHKENGNHSKAADRLGTHRNTLLRILQQERFQYRRKTVQNVQTESVQSSLTA